MNFDSIVCFFNHPFFIVVRGITSILIIAGFCYTGYLVIKGVLPVWYRLGLGLSKRRIAVFGSIENFESIKNTLSDSKIFKEENVVHISADNIDKAKDETIFLVDWQTFGDKIEQVFSARKNHQTPIIIYAKPTSVPQDKMNDIGNRANTVVVNFRGRLLNDLLTSLITTSYER